MHSTSKEEEEEEEVEELEQPSPSSPQDQSYEESSEDTSSSTDDVHSSDDSGSPPVEYAVTAKRVASKSTSKDGCVRERRQTSNLQEHLVSTSHQVIEYTYTRRIHQKGKEPSRGKTHWDFVLEEMTWLAKDYEKERKWKLSQAKKVALKVIKSQSEGETKGHKRKKEEEQRLRRLASNIAKDVKRFWTKVEKLVIYKHQLQLDEKKRRALDKHLDFLLGQTERYSSMLAENLAGERKADQKNERPAQLTLIKDEDGDFVLEGEEMDDEATIDADEALITEEERRDELDALKKESELPLEEILKKYKIQEGESGSDESGEDEASDDDVEDGKVSVDGTEDDGIQLQVCLTDEKPDYEPPNIVEVAEHSILKLEERKVQDDAEYIPPALDDGHEEDDEATLEEEEALELQEGNGNANELDLLKVESEIPVEELLSRYRMGEGSKEDDSGNEDVTGSELSSDDDTGGNSEDTMEIANFLDDTPFSIQERNLSPDPGSPREDTNVKIRLADAAAAAQSAQPTGYTFLTTKVRTRLPFLLKHSLREYQHIGLDWLVTMYDKRLNGILADEMGLGKTIMTIALLAHLACDKGIWGPHLIVVPTSVMLNWETEFMKWCPAFKILTYFGSAKERKLKRQGWSKANSFHVCITTYRLVIQDAKAFKRKKWKYLILDEAHLIKNWKSQRWQTLLNFNSKRRILLTGTPLQNDLMELWSLMHFLMPHVFQSHQEFRDWFCNPISGMLEGHENVNQEVVDRLHNVLRPFLLRRLKQDVEKQLPGKFEHVIPCKLSKRQRNLYEDFMASSDTQATLSSGNFLGLINVLMQLRKVCNHPDLFEGRPIISSFDMDGIDIRVCPLVCEALDQDPLSTFRLEEANLVINQHGFWNRQTSSVIPSRKLIEEIASSGTDTWQQRQLENRQGGMIEEIQAIIREHRVLKNKQRLELLALVSMQRCNVHPILGFELLKCVLMEHPIYDVHKIGSDPARYLEFSSVLANIVQSPVIRCENLTDIIHNFVFVIPAARAPTPTAWCSRISPSNLLKPKVTDDVLSNASDLLTPLRPILVRRQLFFPDRRLLQFDCGKLQELSILLHRLKSQGHRALIFTQMTRMLDILESFINLYGYTYMRLDGSTKPEQRQILMQRFNTNPKIFLFILSTRSGGVGINLVGADTVIFYDSDWNPAMDQQAQDRCHRIGQTREVHIYRLVSESTIEENILKKANQKRFLDDLVIQSGSYTTEFFKKLNPMELFSGLQPVGKGNNQIASNGSAFKKQHDQVLVNVDVEAALRNAEDEADYMAMKRVEQEEAAENQEFTEEGFPANVDDKDFDELEDERTECKSQVENGGTKSELDDGKAKLEDQHTESSLVPVAAEEEIDMLADVRQLAEAAVASGKGSTSFEDQIRPIERYAMRFLERYDPVVSNEGPDAEVNFEEKEWELEQLEKLKEAQEAEIDDDNEPLYYESWDVSVADEAYKQQLEVLAQQQLEETQRQLDWEAMDDEQNDEMDDADHEDMDNSKSKLKRTKKTKFKSLQRSSLGAQVDITVDSDGTNYSDDDMSISRGSSQKKRKASRLWDDEIDHEIQDKKSKKIQTLTSHVSDEVIELPNSTLETPVDPTSSLFKNKFAGKISISTVPMKKAPLVTLEKEKRRDGSKEQLPHADLWMPAEDAVLCAVVHHYGGNWQLASDVLAGQYDGSTYRGRYRHPIHCRERFRQLLLQNAPSCGEAAADKNVPNVGQIKIITEEHTKHLLDVIERMPDNDLLVERHVGAILRFGQQGQVERFSVISRPTMNASPHSSSFVSLASLSSCSTANLHINQNGAGSPSSLLLNALKKVDEEDKTTNTAPAGKVEEEVAFLEVLIDFNADNIFPAFEPAEVKIRIEEDHKNSESELGKPDDDFKPAVEERFREATKLGWEGGYREWASLFSSELSIADLLSPSKSKVLGKRRPLDDIGKASKSKQAKIGGPTNSTAFSRLPLLTGQIVKPAFMESSKSIAKDLASPNVVGSVNSLEAGEHTDNLNIICAFNRDDACISPARSSDEGSVLQQSPLSANSNHVNHHGPVKATNSNHKAVHQIRPNDVGQLRPTNRIPQLQGQVSHGWPNAVTPYSQSPGMPVFPAHVMPYQMHLPGNKASTQSGSQKPLVPNFCNVDLNSSLARRGATGHDLPIPPAAYLHGTVHYGPYPYPFPPPNAGAHSYRNYNVSGQNEAAPRNTPAGLPQEESGQEVRANTSASSPNDADGPDLGLTLGPSFPKRPTINFQRNDWRRPA